MQTVERRVQKPPQLISHHGREFEKYDIWTVGEKMRIFKMTAVTLGPKNLSRTRIQGS